MYDVYDKNLGVIGAGNMASKILKGILNKGLFSQITVSATSEKSLKPWEEAGLLVTTDNQKLAMDSEIILLAVKPQMVTQVLREIGSYLAGKCLVSVVAGVTREQLREAVGEEAFLVRAMPNTPLGIGKGATAVTFGYGTPDPLYKAVLSIFEASGEVAMVQEAQMDYFTAVNGSSPAYFFRMAKAMLNWAKEQGVNEKAAMKMIAKSMEGAGAMLLHEEKTPDELIAEVSSPGGTTIAALSAFDDMNFDAIISEAMSRCLNRATELGESR